VTVARGISRASPRRILAAPALPELLLLGFFSCLAAALAVVPRDPRLDLHLALVLAIIVLLAALGPGLLRAHDPDAPPHPRRVARRMLTLAAVFGIYFQLRWIIPGIHPTDLDDLLNQTDIALLGAPPAVLLQPWQTHFWVEWFAFFYWCYFPILAAYVLGHAALDRDGEHLAGFAGGVILLQVCGWTGYLLLPGFGPYEFLRPDLAPLPGGAFLRMSSEAYAFGPLRDIFPSLHTAHMTYLTLHCLRSRRRHLLYRIVAVPLAFWASQIVIATVYLRWHYVIDVLAGLALAAACVVLGPRLARRWAAFRTAAGEVDPWF